MPGPYTNERSALPTGAITATPARVLRKMATRVLKPRGVVGRSRRRR